MPAITYRSKAIFFSHVPKTGGTSVEAYLAQKGSLYLFSMGKLPGMNVSLQHLHSALVNELYPKGSFDYRFAVLRDPLERLISEYRYISKFDRSTRRGGTKLRRKWLPEKTLDFDQWAMLVLEACRKDPFFADSHIRPQIDFVTADTRTFVYEDGLQPVFDWIDEITDQTPSTSPGIKNRSEAERPQVSEPVEQAIRDFYRDDYALLAEITGGHETDRT